jgi:hypothetical protein
MTRTGTPSISSSSQVRFRTHTHTISGNKPTTSSDGQWERFRASLIHCLRPSASTEEKQKMIQSIRSGQGGDLENLAMWCRTGGRRSIRFRVYPEWITILSALDFTKPLGIDDLIGLVTSAHGFVSKLAASVNNAPRVDRPMAPAPTPQTSQSQDQIVRFQDQAIHSPDLIQRSANPATQSFRSAAPRADQDSSRPMQTVLSRSTVESCAFRLKAAFKGFRNTAKENQSRGASEAETDSASDDDFLPESHRRPVTSLAAIAVAAPTPLDPQAVSTTAPTGYLAVSSSGTTFNIPRTSTPVSNDVQRFLNDMWLDWSRARTTLTYDTIATIEQWLPADLTSAAVN